MEIDPELKHELYTALTSRGMTLKDWFVSEATNLVANHHQPSLFVAANSGNGDRPPTNGTTPFQGGNSRRDDQNLASEQEP